MARFLAVYTMQPEAVTRFRAMPKADQDAVDAVGLEQWKEWERRHAAAFLEPGGMVGKTLRVGKSGTAPATNTICGYVVVEVADTGPGISEDVAAHLFQPFVTSKASGMGIGLSISRRIIEAHGGEISASRNASGGATFRFTLPLAGKEVSDAD